MVARTGCCSSVVGTLLLLVCLIGLASAVPQPPPCAGANSCVSVSGANITYCYGLVNYTTCVFPLTPEQADFRAYNASKNMPLFSSSSSCLNAQRNLLCALYFPKCIPNLNGVTYQQLMCYSTCYNFFQNCNVQLTNQCQFSNGTAPSDYCTGAGAWTLAPTQLFLMAVVLASLLFML